jgi:Tfp pilus assembly protein PilZ
MTIGVTEDVTAGWCAVCGTRHSRVRCLGEVLAIEPERHAWRGTFSNSNGTREAIGVLVAPCDRGWRARVLTYPRRLWTVPGTTCTIKFVAETAEHAEREAREFIEQHCVERDLRPIEDTGLATTVEPFSREESGKSARLDAARRRLCEIHVRFALADDPPLDATVVFASERGVFIATDCSTTVGQAIRIQAELDGLSVAMSGEVRSVISTASPGRPQGIGIRLTDPPARFVSYVRRLV